MKRLPYIIFAVFFGVYLMHTAPWALWGDTAELSVAGQTLTVGHVTGYPLMVNLLKMMSFLPFGSFSWKANCFSALCLALALAVFFSLCARREIDVLPTLAGVISLGTTPLVWVQALKTEVYTLNLLFQILLLAVILNLHPREFSTRRLALLLFIFGLSIGHHLSAFFLLPIILYRLVKSRRKLAFHHICLSSLFLLGLSIYIFLPVRDHLSLGMTNAGIDYIGKFLNYVTGSQYKSAWPSDWQTLIRGITSYFGMLMVSFPVVGSIFGIGGLFACRRMPERLVIVAFLCHALYGMLYQVEDIQDFYTASYIFFAFAIARGVHDYCVFLKEKFRYSQRTCETIIVLIIGCFCYFNFSEIQKAPKLTVNLKDAWEAFDYTRQAGRSTPSNATIVADWLKGAALVCYQMESNLPSEHRCNIRLFLTEQLTSKEIIAPFGEIDDLYTTFRDEFRLPNRRIEPWGPLYRLVKAPERRPTDLPNTMVSQDMGHGVSLVSYEWYKNRFTGDLRKKKPNPLLLTQRTFVTLRVYWEHLSLKETFNGNLSIGFFNNNGHLHYIIYWKPWRTQREQQVATYCFYVPEFLATGKYTARLALYTDADSTPSFKPEHSQTFDLVVEGKQ